MYVRTYVHTLLAGAAPAEEARASTSKQGGEAHSLDWSVAPTRLQRA